jgi:glutaredoxin
MAALFLYSWAFMTIIRWLLGRIILILDALTTPSGAKRSKDAQAFVDQQTKSMAIYQFKACPFCVKVRRALKRHSLDIELRDAKKNETFRNELLTQGGKIKVPCLRIEENGVVQMMYESSEIINYLENRFLIAK